MPWGIPAPFPASTTGRHPRPSLPVVAPVPFPAPPTAIGPAPGTARRPRIAVVATTRSSRSGGDARDRIIAAALDGLRDLDPEGLVSAVGSREIARRAGVSAATIFHHFGSLAGLADAVVDLIFDPSRATANYELIGLHGRNMLESALPLDDLFALHAADFDRMMSDDEFRLRMALFAFADARADLVYRNYLRVLQDNAVRVTEVIFERWGRELRPPFDIPTHIRAKMALLNGSTLRQLVDPQPEARHRFQRVNAALDLLLLRPEGDRHDVDDRLAELNYYPLRGPARGRDAASRAREARILRAAAELFRERGIEAVSLEQVASQADTSVSTLRRMVASKQALAALVVAEQAARALDELGDGAGLREALARLATFAQPRTKLVAAYAAHLASTTAELEDDELLARLGAMRPAPDDARPGGPPTEVVVLALLRQVVSSPAADPAGLADDVLAWFGLDRPGPR